MQIHVLQGEAALSYLLAADADIATINGVNSGAMTDLPPDTATYFFEQPLEDASFDVFIGPEAGFDVEVELPEVEGLRAAIALEVVNTEDGSVARSAPIFATHVGDRLVLTDLTLDLLRDEPRQILTELAEANGDVHALADTRQEAIADVWRALVAATDELGAGSVGDAAAFTATAMGIETFTPVPVH